MSRARAEVTQSECLNRRDSLSLLEALNQPFESGDYLIQMENQEGEMANTTCGADFCHRMKYALYGSACGTVAGLTVTACMVGGSILGASLGATFGTPACAYIGAVAGASIAGAVSGAIAGMVAGYLYKGEFGRNMLYGAAAGFVLGGAAGALYSWGGFFAGPAVMGTVTMGAIKTTLSAAVGTGFCGFLAGLIFPPKPAPQRNAIDLDYDIRMTAT